jgi:hypothetical protein
VRRLRGAAGRVIGLVRAHQGAAGRNTDAWLLSQGREPVNRKERGVCPVVRERLQLSDALARYLGQLGLERKKPPPQDLTAYIEATYSDGGDDRDT